MDPNLIAISAHSAERIIAVLLGGLAVYHGFRLFLVVPVETRSDGRIQLPGLSVVLAKAGPGLFFAAFGAIVVVTSLMRPITVGGDATYQGMTELAAPKGAELRKPVRVAEPDLARVRIAVQTLNCMQRLSSTGSRSLPGHDTELATRDARLALLEGVWANEWGDFDAFKGWAAGGTGGTKSAAKSVFEEERADCPH